MRMGDQAVVNSPVASLVFPVIIKPVLSKVEREHGSAGQSLRAVLSRAESNCPGLMYHVMHALATRAGLHHQNVALYASVLRHPANVNPADDGEYRITRTEERFQELNRRSASLKRILARIPDEITDRKTFLETIKEIASGIKKLLDAVSSVAEYIPGPQGKQTLEHRKRDFVKHSKRFSNTLKEYFKEGQAEAVFLSAACLVHQTNLIMLTVKDKCE
uniref:Programmed cell death protein 10-like n=1 Tax=Hirondellea gigas TaxID=1518452 RepID=A0A6A7FS81_9CRUS